MADEQAVELRMDPGTLYREDTFTDRRVGVIRVMTPVTVDGSVDLGRKILYVGEAQLLSPVGALPITFEIEATSGLLTRRFRAGAVSHAVGPDGTRLYTINPEDGIGVWDLDTGARGPRLGAAGGTDLVVSPDGRFLYVIFGSDQVPDGSRLYIVDRASGALLREVVLGGLARRIEMSGDGTAVITNEAGWVDFVH